MRIIDATGSLRRSVQSQGNSGLPTRRIPVVSAYKSHCSTSGRVINTALDWCEIKNAIVLSIRVVVVLLVLEGTEAHQPRSPAGVLAGASESFTPQFEAFRLGSRDSFEIK